MHRFLFSFIVLLIITASCAECWKTECSNGGECIDGECVCDDGNYHPYCKIDTCMNDVICKNGHCEYGFCICDDYWTRQNCDSLAYSDHGGEYFGGFECNNTTVITDILRITGTEDLDTFRLIEDKTDYRYYLGFENRNRFIIPRQKASGNNSQWIEVSGWGRIKSQEIEMVIRYTTYEFDNIVGYSDCDFEGERN